MSDRQTGVVKWFDKAKGYGFIEMNESPDIFVHYRSIRGEGFRTLIQGQHVEFSVGDGEKGLKAEDVAVLE